MDVLKIHSICGVDLTHELILFRPLRRMLGCFEWTAMVIGIHANLYSKTMHMISTVSM